MILQLAESRSAVTQILQFEEKSPKEKVLVLQSILGAVSLCRKGSTHERESVGTPWNNYFAGCPRATVRLRIGI